MTHRIPLCFFLFCAFCIGCSREGYAQGPLSNLHIDTVAVANVVSLSKSVDIAPETVQCFCLPNDSALPDSVYRIEDGNIRFDTALIAPDCRTLRIIWRSFPFAFGKSYYRFDSLAWNRAVAAGEVPIEFDFGQNEPKDKALLQAQGLQSSGTYTRGLALGNNQNLSFNSDLNLQLGGRIGNDIEINAAIADNSVPIQPDGSTRNLQEFDRIYIQLKRKQTSLLAGDFELSQAPGGYFSRYYKKLQGATTTTRFAVPKWRFLAPPSGTDSVYVRAGAAVSRGKFNRMTFAALEGNQGPYRMQGAEGERFIIVLGGTEKVFIDGILMKRGIEDDYIIDYNLGEITFTSRQLITKDKRIIIEFEYVIQNYLRTTLTTDTEWRRGKNRIYLNTYSEQDNQNSSGIQQLTPSARQLLSTIGDSISNAVTSGLDTLTEGFDASRVLYKWADSTACGASFRVLVYSTSRDSANVGARFSEVPFGQGNYVLASTSANGRVYTWVAPDELTCQPKGNFEPVVRLTTPEQRQLFTLGGEFQPREQTKITVETALSNRDVNRFSPIDNADDHGIGAALGVRHRIALGGNNAIAKQKAPKNSLLLSANYEFAQDRFKPLNPYRQAEFVRDWNIEQITTTVTEHLGRAAAELQLGNHTTVQYAFGLFDRANTYLGNRHQAQLKTKHKGFELFSELNRTTTEGIQGNSVFDRPKVDVSQMFFRKAKLPAIDSSKRDSVAKPVLPPGISPSRDSTPSDSLGKLRTLKPSAIPFLQLGAYWEREKNPRREVSQDDLLSNSFWYDVGRLYLRMPEQKSSLQWEMFLARRNDYAPVTDVFRQSTQADELGWKGNYNPVSKRMTNRLQWNLTRRVLDIVDPQLTQIKGQTTWLGRVDYGFTLARNAISLNTGYEVSSGQNPKLEFTYIQVNPGEGTYSWIDRNQDSILQVDEMEIAAFQDQASYIRLAVTTTEFIQTNNLAFNQNLRIEPRIIWAKKKGVKKAISRFSIQSSFQLNRKIKEGAPDISPWNPFELMVADTSLVSVSGSGRQTLFFRRAHPIWEASVSQATQRNRFVATTGFESRGQDEWALRARINPLPEWTIETQTSTRQIKAEIENFDNRDYQIREYTANPELNWLYKRKIRTSLSYRLVLADNQINLMEKLERHNLSIGTTIQPKPKKTGQGQTSAATSVRAQMTLAAISFKGQANTPVAFVMMEGLQNGKNYLWNLSLDRQLSKFMQLSLTYEGRRPGTGKVVHVGRAQVRALF